MIFGYSGPACHSIETDISVADTFGMLTHKVRSEFSDICNVHLYIEVLKIAILSQICFYILSLSRSSRRHSKDSGPRGRHQA